MNELSFSSHEFSLLFPYFFCFNLEGRIESFGKNIPQICRIEKGGKFNDFFELIRNPKLDKTIDSHFFPIGEMIIIHSFSSPYVYIKGKFEIISNRKQYIFIGSPCYITNKEEIEHQFSLISEFSHEEKSLKNKEYIIYKEYDNIENVINFFENNEFFSSIYNSSNEKDNYSITISNHNAEILWCNSNFLELSGHTFEEIKGKRPRDILYGKRSVYIGENFVDDSIRERRPFYFENVGYTNLGKEFWFGVTVYPILNKQNEIIGRIHVLNDISFKKIKELEQEENENLLKLALEAAKSGAWSYDIISGEFHVSDLFKEITNINDEHDQISLNSIRGKMHPEDKLNFPEEIAAGLKSSSSNFVTEYRILVNGIYRYFNVTCNCIKWTSNGKPVKLVGMLRDITNEKEHVIELQKQKKFYEQILNEIPADIAVFDNQHRYLFVNPKGISDEKLRKWIIGKNDEEYCIYRNRNLSVAEGRRKLFNEVVSSGKIKEWEEQFKKNDGLIEYNLRKMYPVFNENKELEIVIGYGVNITEVKKIEDILEFYKQALNETASVAITDKKGIITYVNQKFCDISKYSENELIGQDHRIINSGYHSKEFIKDVWITIANGKLWRGEFKNKAKDGSFYWFDTTIVPFLNDHGTPYQYVGIRRDITEKKKKEQELENFFQLSNDLLCIANINGYFVKISPAFTHLLGYTETEILKTPFINFIHPDDATATLKGIERLAVGSSATNFEIRLICRDKKILLFSWSATSDKETRLIFASGRNITQSKKQEDELRKAKSEAEISVKAKEIFLANISHEIRTPMNGILGIGNLLNKTKLDIQQKSYLNIIQNAANNLLIIINDLLDISKIESGKLTLECIGFDLNATIKNTVDILNHKAEEKGLLLSFNNQNEISPVLIGDPYRINQVLINLLNNSVKFTEKGEVKIVCNVLSQDANSQKIQFHIIDTGIGIRKDFLFHLFDKFSQEDESVTRRFGGTGLGMSISKQIVELMGGTMYVQSEKNLGTTISFEINFPIGDISDLPEKLINDIDNQVLNGKRILLVEDNEVNRFLTTTILTIYGADVTEAENGMVAIHKLEGNEYDLILMDVQMPVKNGIETTQYIRKYLNGKIPIIALTANAYKTEENRCLEVGMNDFISKPFDELKLIHIATKWLGLENIKKSSLNNELEKEFKENMKQFDLSNLKLIGRGNDAFVSKMIQLFIKTVPDVLQQMQEAYDQKQWKKLAALAHRIKSTISSMDIKTLEEDIELLENPHTVDKDEAETLFHLNHLINVMSEAVQQLKIM